MRLVTWAMQGPSALGRSRWGADVARLFETGAEIVCLQNCGAPPASARVAAPPPWRPGCLPSSADQAWAYALWNAGSKRRPIYVNIVWLQTGPLAGHTHLAIAFSCAAVAALQLIHHPASLPGQRPVLGVRVSYGGAPLDLYTLHTLAPGGADGPALIRRICSIDTASWFAAGIYHTPPESWNGVLPSNAIVCPHNGPLAHPGSSTHLDYAIKSAAGGALHGTVLAGFVVAEHSPIAYLL